MHEAPYDLRDYALGELNAAQTEQMERYLVSAPQAREEVDRLRMTLGVLRSVPEENPPRRIAFISDKVFEPTAWGRLRQRLSAGAPRLAFGAAVCLAVLFAGLKWTAPTVTVGDGGWQIAFAQPAAAPAPQPASVDPQELRAIVEEVVAAGDERQREELVRLINQSSDEQAARWRADLDGVQSDMETGWRMLKTDVDKLYKEVGGFDMAAVR